MNIPTEKTVKLSGAERFCIGLKELAKECGCYAAEYSLLGIRKFNFKDGSSIGGMLAMIESGIVDRDTYLNAAENLLKH